jgi:hypothetical protein
LKCFLGLLENILEARLQFLKGIHISRLDGCQLKTTNVQGKKAPPNQQKTMKKFETHS